MSGAKWLPTLILITAFQVISVGQIAFTDSGINMRIISVFGAYIAIEWIYTITSSIIRKKASPALEFIAFFLTGIGLLIVASVNEKLLVTQFIAFTLGFFCFMFLLWLISDMDRAMFMRTPMAIAAVGLLIITLIFAKNIHGAYNWIGIGSFSFQPSELVKIAFIFVGAAALDKLQSTRSLTKYIIFAVVCIALLFLMRDLGTALIFFFTFLILAFMRSGDIRTLILVCVAAAMGAALIVLVKSDYVIRRFSIYRHIWENMDGSGYQQTRVLIYSVSGGLFGVGIGNGKLKDIFAATEDLVFGVLCEEWGIIMGILVILCFALIATHSIKCAVGCRYAFYTIASVAAGGLLLFQASLNVFGVTDLLPLTGVTLPFISRGGSSAISCWALLAFIKAADNRTWLGSRYNAEVVE
ncbi:MAG: FtsW/RodA/SpoVE family cell cycle protein [Clostridia bacterium]|nr:FtsW/RodA/SpoVE family cell cycle protein [Clostridia bacterium]